MVGFGTIADVLLIVAGGGIGLVFKRALTERMQDMLMKTLGLCIGLIGAQGALEQMLRTSSARGGASALLVGSLALGCVVGETLKLEQRIKSLGNWLKQKASPEDARFTNAFVTASLTVSIGAMSIMGSIQDGMYGDWSTLVLKGALDALIICTMSASMGMGCIFSALPVAVLQGSITLFAHALAPHVQSASLANLSLVGSALVLCVGINLIRPHTFKAANMLPAVIIAALWPCI